LDPTAGGTLTNQQKYNDIVQSLPLNGGAGADDYLQKLLIQAGLISPNSTDKPLAAAPNYAAAPTPTPGNSVGLKASEDVLLPSLQKLLDEFNVQTNVQKQNFIGIKGIQTNIDAISENLPKITSVVQASMQPFSGGRQVVPIIGTTKPITVYINGNNFNGDPQQNADAIYQQMKNARLLA
jgi:hypothetical protein